ncbi:polyphenol oxidase family protein [Arthrobacter sp. ERGS1:01]|uniref:polyphenol oxidase family protein n=1 Tax=Arthrobacter sp. ERGS1:01 TaxID=1704044 RepID=UPI000AE60219|nr:polyphenol oxidase family protein [Arthrobacter sp. ERGS1:01]
MGFTNSDAGNLAFHVGDDPARVRHNRDALDAGIGALGGSGTPTTLHYMNQVHGNDVAVLAAPNAETPAAEAPTADALVSRSASLAVMVADCVPVVLAGVDADGTPMVGVAHAGRPGVEKGVVEATVRELRLAGAQSLQAWIGPSVCGRCYEVPAAMRDAVAAVAPAAFATTSWGTPALDLPAAVEWQLGQLGVNARNVGVCTLEHPEFFSHRRAVRDGEAEGRFIGFAALLAPNPLSTAKEPRP